MLSSTTCDPDVHATLVHAGELLDRAWKCEFIRLKVSFETWSRLEEPLRKFSGVHGVIGRWAVDSVLIRARHLSDPRRGDEYKANPIQVMELLMTRSPSLTVAELVAHQACGLREPLDEWIVEQYEQYLLSCGLFDENLTLSSELIRARLENTQKAQRRIRNYVNKHVAHAQGDQTPEEPLTDRELEQFFIDVGEELRTWLLVTSFTGTSDEVAHIRFETELVDALTMWDKQRFDTAMLDFATSQRSMSRKEARDWFLTRARTEFAVDGPQ